MAERGNPTEKICGTCGKIRATVAEEVNQSCQTCKNRIGNARGKLRSLLANPNKIGAQQAAKYARACGEIIPKPCEDCGDLNVVGHHDTYLQGTWLAVRWLCLPCHNIFHKTHTYNEESQEYEQCT